MTTAELFPDLDSSVSPADDLYRHVNGRWLERAVIPDDQASTGSFRLLRDASEEAVHQILEELSAGNGADLVAAAPEATEHEAGLLAGLYRRFMDTEAVEAAGVSPLAPILAEVASISSVPELIAFLGRGVRRGVAGLFYLEEDSDPGDPDRYVPWTGQAGIGLPDEAYYRDDDKAEIRDSYLAHVQRSLELAAVPGDAAALARRVMDLETEIASHHWDQVRNRDMQATYNPTSFADLSTSHPGLLLDTWRQAADIPETVLSTVVVNQPSFFDEVEPLLRDDRLADWRAWAAWNVVRSYSPFLSADLVEQNFAFYGRVLSGTPQLRTRWKRAVGFVESVMGEALGKFYVARHFPPAAKQRMDQLVARILEAYRVSISRLDWMGEQTRAEALTKLSNFRPKIGYPDKWRDFSGLQLPEGGLFEAAQAATSFEVDRMIEKLSGPMDPDEWLMYPQTVNAYYHPLRNEIVFPAAILQPPFFDVNADDAVNYGAIGAVIGHEIGHGFDDQGSTCDGHGRLRDWWTEDDRTAFKARTRALIDQYDALVPVQLQPDGPHVNGALTIGENIGDLGGVGIAFLALTLSFADSGEPAPIDGLTWQQRFFLSYAAIWQGKYRDEALRSRIATDPHSPDELRCNQIVRNVDAFYRAFDVTPSNRLWLDPDQRVTIW
ncbi:M13 family metallopeptidase [Acidipropionibacterium jensenii]|uniref:Neutral endopeptidase n=1 Tax=Acidipropionibacterium jensenii TaxID=1749 RepID=A0A448P1A9_9ACTN|nr:M13-type metalloendopeptidase [Acidipropionibacterium jensenii]MDN5976685.1 peptidase M13 [Acidipropionibacterium jensenii]MDN5996292.1 peptidase M13 [Acidipropionibacterium jensenii]MDN6021009.1 peptidase M13 [Acidipropionibacterium jensenii]MDN6427809.1 peptidase M13 [Acidipropionibacterium jensenii]MDN6591774.1 peptidase M13 [Acidipropionibacterium jensenii]